VPTTVKEASFWVSVGSNRKTRYLPVESMS
jgi:hypothetical protein